MQIAQVDGKPSEAFPGGRGICPLCGSVMISKCGPRKIHHWAHFGRRICDPWWESETAWHREWKNCFPISCREVCHVAPNSEIHRADVKTETGIVIEFQHSSISDNERISREEFYENMVWVVDGRLFDKNFDIYHMLPDPDSLLAQDLIWYKAKRHMRGANHGLYIKLSEAQLDYPSATKASFRGGYIYSIEDIKEEVENCYRGHHQYDWVRPRATWIEAKCPVYIDFGEDYLCRLDVYDSSGLKCVRFVSKRKFIHDVMTETDVYSIATRFYPINKVEKQTP